MVAPSCHSEIAQLPWSRSVWSHAPNPSETVRGGLALSSQWDLSQRGFRSLPVRPSGHSPVPRGGPCVLIAGPTLGEPDSL